ncbi:heat shock protein hsp-12.2-related [Holotrichia oblita]|uniref:Heat shock protein hsp-12.2-related n=1 Tax=Holotrichia oblita TaxID=644536 RepID=A0ACB9T8B6_HOLOL|nr:heat shock protein hsp-12.2-related [Holotrichia oblita]
MSLFPYYWDDFRYTRPSKLPDQQFGLGLTDDDLLSPLTLPYRSMARSPLLGYYRPWRSPSAEKDAGSTVSVDKDKFQVNLDVQHFSPNEITVKISGKNTICVEGKHEEKLDDHGYISRHFVRKYVLPEGVNVDKIISNLSSDGVLTITAPKHTPVGNEERTIPISQTGLPSKTIETKMESKPEQK